MKIQNFLIIISLLFSCRYQKEVSFIETPQIVENPNNSVPLSAYLSFETERQYKSIAIELKSETKSWRRTYKWSEKSPEGFPIYMVYPDQNYQISFQLTDLEGQLYHYDDTLIWQSPAIPVDPAEFLKIVVEESIPSKMAQGFTLMNPRRRVPLNLPNANKMNQQFGMLLVVDAQGEVVWYYRTDSRISDFDLLGDSAISYLTQDSRLQIMDWMGNLQESWYAANRPEGTTDQATPVEALTFHHDATFLPNGNVVILSSEYVELPDYYTSEVKEDAPRKSQKVMGDIIIEFAPSGEVVWEWHAFDHMDPYRIGYETFSGYWERRGFPGVIDWSHANAISYNEKDNAYIINYRYQSALMKIDKKTKNINWIFGEPSGWDQSKQEKLVSLSGESTWFWHQHSPSFNKNGNLLLFNNSNYQARPFTEPVDISNTRSHIVEYELNEESLTAKEVWNSLGNDEEQIVSIAMGDVDYLDNGNILGAYGALISRESLSSDSVNWQNRARFPQWTMIREYMHTDPPEKVWELQLVTISEDSNIGWTIFGAERFEVKDIY